ncbi:MAG: POTRA domain-containing protein, partial [Acidobacteriota bacterium]
MVAQSDFENRRVNSVELSIDGSTGTSPETEQFRAIAADAVGNSYSAVKIRESIDALHHTGRIVSVIVKAKEDGAEGVIVQYLVKFQTEADKVSVEIGNQEGTTVKEQDLLFKLSLLNSGASINDQTLQDNANLILEYLRDLGYYNAEVKFKTQPSVGANRVNVTFVVNPNVQAKIQEFKINIDGYHAAKILPEIQLKPGEGYTRALLDKDVEKVKSLLRKDDFLAPELEEPR